MLSELLYLHMAFLAGGGQGFKQSVEQRTFERLYNIYY